MLRWDPCPLGLLEILIRSSDGPSSRPDIFTCSVEESGQNKPNRGRVALDADIDINIRIGRDVGRNVVGDTDAHADL